MIQIDNEARQVNIKDQRYYLTQTDRPVWSVTTILQSYPKGKFFEDWLKEVGKNAEIIVKEAATRGTNVHNGIEDMLHGNALRFENFSLDEWQMLMKFKDFYETYYPSTQHIEIGLASNKLKFGGTVDYIASMGGETWMIDHKTSKAVHETYFIQLAAYCKLIKDQLGLTIDRIGVLWLNARTRGVDKSGKKIQGKGWHLVEPTESIDELYEMFKHVFAVHRHANGDYPEPYDKIYPMDLKLEQ